MEPFNQPAQPRKYNPIWWGVFGCIGLPLLFVLSIAVYLSLIGMPKHQPEPPNALTTEAPSR